MLTVKQVSDALDIYPSTVRRWCEAGQHPMGWGVWAEKMGRDWFLAAALCWCGRVIWLAPTSRPGEYSGLCECGLSHKESHRVIGGKQ